MAGVAVVLANEALVSVTTLEGAELSAAGARLSGPMKLAISAFSMLLLVSCGLSPFDTPQPQIEIKPDGTFNAMQMQPADAEHLVAKQATNVAPVLFPAYLSDGMKTCVANGNRDSFVVSCFGGARILSLQTQSEDLASYKPKTLRRLTFRGDKSAQFMDVNPADVGAVKLVVWSGPGHSSAPACSCVRYDLHAVGVTETEFWKIANSLGIAKAT